MAIVRADAAAVETARLQLGYSRIAAPIDGVAGRLLVQRGNLVKANDASPLVVLNRVRPVYVAFDELFHQLKRDRVPLAR